MLCDLRIIEGSGWGLSAFVVVGRKRAKRQSELGNEGTLVGRCADVIANVGCGTRCVLSNKGGGKASALS